MAVFLIKTFGLELYGPYGVRSSPRVSLRPKGDRPTWVGRFGRTGEELGSADADRGKGAAAAGLTRAGAGRGGAAAAGGP